MAAESNNNPFSVRMDEKDKGDLIELIQESGKGPKEFMTLLMSAYKLSKAQVEIPEMAEDIKHLEAITTQICEIYIGIGKRITTIGETNAMQYNKDLLIYKEKITLLEENISKINIEKTDLLNKISTLSIDNKEAEKQILSATNTIDDKTKLIDDKNKLIEEYRDKNDNLLSMLKDLKDYKDKVDTLSNLLADSQSRNLTLENSIEKLKNENENTINKLTDKIKNLDDLYIKREKDHEKELSIKDNEYLKGMESLKKSEEYEKDKALLDQEKNFNKIINDITNENNIRIASIQEHNNKQIFDVTNESNIRIAAIQESGNKQIFEYQNKIEALLKNDTEKKTTTKNIDTSKPK